ncbi:hypothetical protein BCV39_14775 [Vibrio sp. 10N.286.55.E10]|uniref:hypothetical protein n=1 Tax=unclassified Vibrio TaxID=2614977 RepID=UPI000C82E9B1|nr:MULTISPECIES: hypothetical protein [unclassified Vibrio]PME27443.1 hypothetical protein BCV40_16835 [Vibrio sp. 10N.286.55.E12]PME36806.1 hypothetical protein BCV39_14775 [Vibrio sp. 10N.286.55.E10]PME69546.1 hypothetical protein BCV32_01715 [Vibrio sp. 10N.286.55.C11]
MDNRIQLNFIKYTFFELVFVTALLAFVYWISGGDRQSLPTIGLMFSAVAVLKVVTLWWQFRNRSFEISNNHVCFDGYACDIKLQGSILPFGIGSVIKLSYTKGAMQKRNIYLPKGAMNQDEWQRVLACRA